MKRLFLLFLVMPVILGAQDKFEVAAVNSLPRFVELF